MNSEIKIYPRLEGAIQRVQVVRWEDWSELDFLYPKPDAAALGCFADIYRNFLVPACPWIFPQMVMFSLPEDVDIINFIDDSTDILSLVSGAHAAQGSVVYNSKRYGEVTDSLMAASILLQEGMKLKKGQSVFTDAKAEALYRILEARDCIRIVRGKMPKTQIIPVGNVTGYLSQTEKMADLKVNASFFIMDPIDCATIYDQVGTVLGLCVKNGVVQNPPLFHREALLVKNDGSVSILAIDAKDLTIEICGKQYKHGENATIYCRPERIRTPEGTGLRLIIVGNRVVAVKRGGRVEIPASGFVLCVDSFGLKECSEETELKREIEETRENFERLYAGASVVYHGLEDVQFGIQVGNSIVRDGVKTESFISKFYNIYHLEPIPYPPSLYPMNFEKARAARIALGADNDGKPVLFWAEGAGKFGMTPGVDSTGATLTEMAEIAVDLGMENAINLDGGGSAQILLKNQRLLHISDRKREDNSDAERLIPLGLVVRS